MDSHQTLKLLHSPLLSGTCSSRELDSFDLLATRSSMESISISREDQLLAMLLSSTSFDHTTLLHRETTSSLLLPNASILMDVLDPELELLSLMDGWTTSSFSSTTTIVDWSSLLTWLLLSSTSILGASGQELDQSILMSRSSSELLRHQEPLLQDSSQCLFFSQWLLLLLLLIQMSMEESWFGTVLTQITTTTTDIQSLRLFDLRGLHYRSGRVHLPHRLQLLLLQLRLLLLVESLLLPLQLPLQFPFKFPSLPLLHREWLRSPRFLPWFL